MVEQLPFKQLVLGSNPSRPTSLRSSGATAGKPAWESRGIYIAMQGRLGRPIRGTWDCDRIVPQGGLIRALHFY